MGIQVALHHRTQYRYAKPVSLGPQTVQLRPAPHCRTPILSYSLEITPSEHTVSWHFDALSNHVARVLVPQKTLQFGTDVRLTADLTAVNPFDFLVEPAYATFPFHYSPELAQDLAPYLSVEPAGPLQQELLASLSGAPQSTVSFLVSLNERLRDEISYTMRMEHGVQSCEQTLELRSGSCRDSAWLLVQVCRHLGIAARFVSGYLIQLAEDSAAADDSTAPKVDSVDLHAWAEVFFPGAGWIGFDPTSGLLAAEGHIPLACTPTPPQAAPVSGTVEPAEVAFTFDFSVRRLDGGVQLTQPYTESEWAAVRGVAHRIDLDLNSQDVRLTLGGEPTFVGIDEPESPQWHVEALGDLKRTRGLQLIRALREHTAPGGLLHLGQGKWYPGEPLPRWAFFCISRTDDVPVWENAELFALETEQYSFTAADGLRYLGALTRRLGTSDANILAAFDPQNEAHDASASTPSSPTGYVLPLRRRQPAGRLAWSSQLWFPRPERLVLSPGDSPIGYRIPVEAMPWVAPDDLEYELEDGSVGNAAAGQVKLPAHPARHPERFGTQPMPDRLSAAPERDGFASVLIRPSLCVQVCDGRMHVFLPFVPVLADYLDLVAAVEDTSQHLGVPVWIEGYPPPLDPRVRSFGLTPDPGVLEVNLPPAKSWDELETVHEVLAGEAQRLRLIEGKFGYDGSHLATGGGNHIVLGGATLADSPLLRRPDLLRSMITFWQNHPSLSYLFSGMYVGPTSQYPRVDEARVDALYELELAFSHLPKDGCSPDILDGLFRNLLVDVTGNTHRAEFCIDKLHPPEGAGLRLGLLELRAFEMAPHVRMGLLQPLLVRALVSLFWKQPFHGALLRWGTALHDRFMLPHFVWRDFAEVLRTLRSNGYAFQEAWFKPHFEFRFPHIGRLTAEGVALELRQALEPWNVLAEETTSGGTGRSVDSSLERMQVRLTGTTADTRYVVSCNGRRVPLHPTEQPGEAIAGIRYRARKLSASLHPTIPVHTPLQFELIDTSTQRCIGRCVYYAGPPDGTVHTTRPANAAEARVRRLQRFQVLEPGNGVATVPEAEINPSFPMTLDLRWPSILAKPRHDEIGSGDQ